MLLKSLRLDRFLSFGPGSDPIELSRLNVLIGPNGSGKSNFIEAIGFLRAAPTDLLAPVRQGGGVSAWIWRGEPGAKAEVEAVLAYRPESSWNLRHRVSFTELGARLEIVDERIEDEEPPAEPTGQHVYFGYEHGRPMLNVRNGKRELRREDIDPQQSILSQRKDPDHYPELSFVGDHYSKIRLYRDWGLGRASSPRHPQPSDLPTDHLREDAQNLGLILNRFRRDIPTKRVLLDALQQVFDGVVDFSVQIEGGTVQIFLEEERWTLPATRLSDGTIRWLALLAILLDPAPPPLVCIEEPELGLHPDLMPTLARLLLGASERTQVIVTTHSDVLVDALSDTPEAVLVCERHEGQTTLRRLTRDALSTWLEAYTLGELWRKGELGGTRW
ncbi:AAA family ATPase [Sorangium sp. So ce861]|uniref:AAA family ATPase n=1 Tax=Sorangium sp. So ce861 TaxID=3133323 RepID=UPI003F61D4CE